MRTDETFKGVPEFDLPQDAPPTGEFRPSAKEFGRPVDSPGPVDNEFEAVPPPSLVDPEDEPRAERKKARRKRNFLLQAAAIVVAVVVTTSAMGVDVLGDELSGDLLKQVLHEAGAKKGEITVSMLWSTSDDLDLHVVAPDGTEVFFGNPAAAGGELDVDMQVGSIVEHPVENIYFYEPQRGDYRVYVHNYSDRNPGDPQVLIQVTVRGRTKSYTITLDQWMKDICTFTY